VSVLINTFVTCVFARGYYGRVTPGDAAAIGLENAGKYLGATYGAGMVVIWVRLTGRTERLTAGLTGVLTAWTDCLTPRSEFRGGSTRVLPRSRAFGAQF
jgi:hypothetical protein